MTQSGWMAIRTWCRCSRLATGTALGLLAAIVFGANTQTLAQDTTLENETGIDSTATLEAHAPAPDFGTADSWRWALYGGAAVDIRRDTEQYQLTWAASYFIVDDFSIDFELAGLYFDQPSRGDSTDTFGGNFNLLFRWHFYNKDRWTIYADAGAGMLLAGDEVPPQGTEFNFTPQAGAGVTYDLGGENNARLMTGIRWHHISNARTGGSEDNPGRDAIMAYIGLSFPF